VLDDHLKEHKYLVGGGLTLADFAVAASLIYARPAHLPLEKYENLRAWYAHIESLDAWKKSLPAMMPS
jgi:glutathione S-transferase